MEYELRVNRKGTDKKIPLKVNVDPVILKQIDDSIDTQYVLLKGKRVLLKDLNGDCVIGVFDIKLAQIAWLLMKREIVYAFMEKDNKEIAIGIKERKG